MGNAEDESEGWHNPNAEGYVLEPGQKRVRFSFSEPVFHIPPDIDEDSLDENDSKNSEEEATSEEISRLKYLRTKRRDSVYPTMGNDKRIIIDPEPGMKESNLLKSTIPPPPEDEEDPFEIKDFEEEPSTPWSDLTMKEKLEKVAISIAKGVGLLILLYFFVCSLDLLSKGFRLIGGRTAGKIFQQSDILQNPVVGLMIGILTTVLVQSSSTSTSIIVGMVAAGFMDVKSAIPLIMGSNIGTSITNTIVSFMQAADKEQFRKAFAGATILDMFNWITVIVLLPVEVLTGYLYHVTKAIVDGLAPDPKSGGEIKLLSALTEPFINLIVQLDESVLDCWSNPNCTDKLNASLIMQKCSRSTAKIEVTERIFDLDGNLISTGKEVSIHTKEHACSSEFLFAGTSMSDLLAGIIILILSLIVLCTCLILIVKLLSSVLRGHVSVVIKKVLNADFLCASYISIAIGAGLTFLVQSSSVFTSALTPLVGLGVISLKRVYPLTLGSNLGTTSTAVLAAFAVEPKSFAPSMQIALCHLFFNITGILLFYPLPFTRFPIQMAKFLGNKTAEYRWFAVFYMVLMFGVVPVIFVGLAFAGSLYVIILLSIVGILILALFLIKLMQKKYPQHLPIVLRNWKWLPLPLRSLKPYDDLFARLPCCASCRQQSVPATEDCEKQGHEDGNEDGKRKSFTIRNTITRENDLGKTSSSNYSNQSNKDNFGQNISLGDEGECGISNGHIPTLTGNSLHNRRNNYNSLNGDGKEDRGDVGSDNEGYEVSTEESVIV